MDIGSILASAAEDTYDSDFDNEPVVELPSRSGGGRVESSVMDTLRVAAVKVENESIKEAAKALYSESHEIAKETVKVLETVEEMKTSLEDIESHAHVQVVSMQSTLHLKKDDEIDKHDDDYDAEDIEDESEDDEDATHEDPRAKAREVKYFSSIFNDDKKTWQSFLRPPLDQDNFQVNLRALDRHGWSALHWAAAKGMNEFMSSLLEVLDNKGLKLKKFVNLKENISGWTALHVACIHCEARCIRLLKSYGASLKVKDRLFELPVDCIGAGRAAEEVYELVRVKGYDDTFGYTQTKKSSEITDNLENERPKSMRK